MDLVLNPRKIHHHHAQNKTFYLLCEKLKGWKQKDATWQQWSLSLHNTVKGDFMDKSL